MGFALLQRLLAPLVRLAPRRPRLQRGHRQLARLRVFHSARLVSKKSTQALPFIAEMLLAAEEAGVLAFLLLCQRPLGQALQH